MQGGTTSRPVVRMARTTRTRRPRWGLLAQFGAGSLVPLLLFGLVLANHERNVIRADQEQSTAEFAKLAARGLLSFILAPSDFDGPLPKDRIAILDVVVKRLSGPDSIPHVRFLGADGTIRYSDEKELIGKPAPDDDMFRRALRGETVAHHSKVRFLNAEDTS